ncbi:MAG: hypothetical protein AAF597_08785 [Bacteroidota bacterium]
MRAIITLLFILVSIGLFAQTELNVIGNAGYLLSPSTKSRVPNADQNDSSFDLMTFGGLEVIFRGKGVRRSVTTRLEYGTFRVDRLNNDFVGSGQQGGSVDSRPGQLVGQARFLGANYLQGCLGMELIPLDQVKNTNFEIAFGVIFILRERVHATTSWIDPETGLAEPAMGGSFGDVGGVLVQDVTAPAPAAPGHLVLSQSMLNRVTPFTELRATFQNWRGISSAIGVQVGLTPLYDKAWYNTETRNNWWLVLKATFRGRLL